MGFYRVKTTKETTEENLHTNLDAGLWRRKVS